MTMTSLIRCCVAIGVGLFAAGASAAGPSTRLDDYVLFAASELRAKTLRVDRGDVGVNAGALVIHGTLDAPDSVVVAATVLLDGQSRCAALFAGMPVVDGSQCAPAQAFTPPIVPDVAAACGLGAEDTSCDPGSPIIIDRDQTLTLSPGVYGAVEVHAGAGHAGSLVLMGGSYVFCSLRVARNATLEADGPVDVLIDHGDLRLSTGSRLVPGAELGAADVVLQTTGAAVSFGRRTSVSARLCAPLAELHLEDDARLEGSFVAGSIRARRIAASGLSSLPTTTTTVAATSTTSTSGTSSSSTSTTSPTTSTTTSTSSSTSSTATQPSVTTSTSSTSTSSSTSSTTTQPTGTTSTSSTTSSSSTSTSTSEVATSSTSSTTTTTQPSTLECPASKLVDATVTLVPALDGSTHSPVAGITVQLAYPASVSLPGTGSLPINDPSDPTTREALLDLNLYNGFVIFVDTDTALRTSVAVSSPFPLAVPYGFERARFDCTTGTVLDQSAFTCTVTDESDSLGGVIGPAARPACAVTLADAP